VRDGNFGGGAYLCGAAAAWFAGSSIEAELGRETVAVGALRGITVHSFSSWPPLEAAIQPASVREPKKRLMAGFRLRQEPVPDLIRGYAGQASPAMTNEESALPLDLRKIRRQVQRGAQTLLSCVDGPLIARGKMA